MGQVCLLDSNRLSGLLRDALSWSDNVSSLMVSATNGSILAYAYRDQTPSVKVMRTQSTTMTAAYTVSSEDSLVFEAQNTGAISVITPIADHVLLAVTGPEPRQAHSSADYEAEEPGHHANGTNGDIGEGDLEDDGDDDDNSDLEGEYHRQIRTDLEVVNQELASVLREELAAMKWPDDI